MNETDLYLFTFSLLKRIEEQERKKGRQMDRVLKAVKLMEEEKSPISGDVVCILLQECTKKKDLRNGRRAHAILARSGLDTVSFYGDHLIRFFAACGHVSDAYKAFYQIVSPTVYSWNSIFTANAKNGDGASSLEMYFRMQGESSVSPDRITFSCILKCCSMVGDLDVGMMIHGQVLDSGNMADSAIGNALVDMYAKCGHLRDAGHVFDRLPHRDVISWGAIIGGYAIQGHGQKALSLYHKMLQDGILPNDVIFLCLMKACCNVSFIRQGKIIHDQLLRYGFGFELTIGSALVDMYIKCGLLEEARKVFESLSIRNVVAWGAIIGGYAQHDNGQMVLELFAKMQKEKATPNIIILLSVLKACGSVGALTLGRLVHCQVIEMILSLEVIVGSTIVDMYSRCGSMDEAQNVFDKMSEKNVVTWGSLVSGYARTANCEMINESLENMHLGGFEPDDLIFTGILTACCHAGLIEQACFFFMSMVQSYGIQPSMEQYCTMAHLLGGAGLLSEAQDIIHTMPRTPDTGMWRSLLTNCRAYGNTGLGGSCLDHATQIHPSDASSYVLLSNAYVDAQMYDCVNDKVDESKRCLAMWKTPKIQIDCMNANLHEMMTNSKSIESEYVAPCDFKSMGNQTRVFTSNLGLGNREFLSNFCLVLSLFYVLDLQNVNQKPILLQCICSSSIILEKIQPLLLHRLELQNGSPSTSHTYIMDIMDSNSMSPQRNMWPHIYNSCKYVECEA